MKTRIFVIITLLCLLIPVCPFCSYAAGPDGFANVPWGKDEAQANQVLGTTGVPTHGPGPGGPRGDGRIGHRYSGTLAGVAGTAELCFMSGTFAVVS